MARKPINPAAVDWLKHFETIREQCPWSLAAWRLGLIQIEPWRGIIKELGSNQARIYTTKLNARQIKKVGRKAELEYPQYEFLISAPQYGPWGTPCVVMIQQDREKLEFLRRKIGYYTKT